MYFNSALSDFLLFYKKMNQAENVAQNVREQNNGFV
jgi:hypothetical protein